MEFTPEELTYVLDPKSKKSERLAAIDSMFVRSCNLHTLQEIQSYFLCPVECEGVCCKRENVQLLESDFRRMKSAMPKVWIKPCGEIVPGIYGFELDMPCQFLNDSGRCSVHDVKPLTCRMYPFRFVEGDASARGLGNINPADYLSLDICPMSLELMKNYVQFYTEFLDSTDADKEFKAAEARSMARGMEVYEKGIANFRENGIKNCAALRLDLMPYFADWLRDNHSNYKETEEQINDTDIERIN